MEGTLRVDPQKLISTADEFGATGSQIRTLTDQMISITDSLRNVWEGDAANTYSTKFGQLKDDMERMYRMIDEHVKDLNEMAQRYMEVENFNTETGNSLAGDVIS